MYDRLRQVAAQMRRDERMLTVGATELVHEALLRAPADILEDLGAHVDDVRREMGRVVVDRARRRNARKRGGGSARLERGTCLEQAPAAGSEERSIADLDLRLALERLGSVSPYLREVFRLRYEVDLGSDVAAAVLSVSPRTFRRDLLKVRGLLGHFLSSSPDRPPFDRPPLD